MNINLFSISLALFLWGLPASLSAQELSEKMKQEVDQVFSEFDGYDSPGGALAVVQKARLFIAVLWHGRP